MTWIDKAMDSPWEGEYICDEKTITMENFHKR